MSVISVENVGLTIKKDVILDNINFEVSRGEILGVVGRNGSGKTMLMKCICGFITCTEGRIAVCDKQIGKDIDFPSSTGIIIETPGFIPYYSGFRNLKVLSELNRKIGNKEIIDAMKTVGLDPAMKKMVKKYSMGMRQRLGIAQAIMEEPDVLILDEPFNGLDSQGVNDIRNLLLEYKKQGKTMIVSSHITEDINILCDRVIYLDKGRMVEKL